VNDPGLWSYAAVSLREGRRCALLLTVTTEGSGPGRPGAAMAVTNEDSFGTVGGGTLELSLVRKARQMLETGSVEPELIEHQHSEVPSGNAFASGMICSGTQTTAVLPLDASLLVPLELAAGILTDGLMGTLTLDRSGLRIIEGAPANPTGFVLSECDDWSFSAMLGLEDTVYIIGGGHVGQALAELLVRLPFRPVVIDSREAPSQNLPFEWVRAEFGQACSHIPEGDHSWAVVMTPMHSADLEVLNSLTDMHLKYVGLMASSAKRETIFQRLRETGVSDEWLESVRSPIGLSIGAKSPWEIAVSVAAELLSCKN